MKTKDRKHLTLVYNQKVCDDSITMTFYKEKNISNNYSRANRKKCIVVKRSIADVDAKMCIFNKDNFSEAYTISLHKLAVYKQQVQGT